jgi:DNA-binding FrmR family transcriptional regulator
MAMLLSDCPARLPLDDIRGWNYTKRTPPMVGRGCLKVPGRERPERTMDHSSHDSRKVLDLLKTARGQVDAIVRMVEDDRYCIDVSKQVHAAVALLKKANLLVLKQHMNTCVKDAVRTNKGAEKIEEIAHILEKYLA